MNETVKRAVEIIKSSNTRDLRIMEVCGTHTHEIFRMGIRKLLPENIKLISGPGCPVCVTPVDYIDEAVMLALEKNAVICTFGDLVRVPGTSMSLALARGKGAKVVTVYSPLDATKYAEEHPSEEVVFLSVGFETTAPSDCISVKTAVRKNLKNYSVLTSNKTMPGAYRAMKDSADAFLYPGHVHAITGTGILKELLSEGVSGVVTGFTAAEITTALATVLKKTETGKPFFENCYPRVVRDEGNVAAMKIIDEFMEPCDAVWRGIGEIKNSGLKLRSKYADYDARIKFSLPVINGKPNPACRCGQVLQGKILPSDCPLFGRACTPEHPVGACMVSGEGACSAFYLYGGNK
ncbi:MAG: hydrogenase formation protein HypD [Clostridiales bacterium]|nr:hydrogenase formation protein HypD [Clostridiales bacterium]